MTKLTCVTRRSEARRQHRYYRGVGRFAARTTQHLLASGEVTGVVVFIHAREMPRPHSIPIPDDNGPLGADALGLKDPDEPLPAKLIGECRRLAVKVIPTLLVALEHPERGSRDQPPPDSDTANEPPAYSLRVPVYWLLACNSESHPSQTKFPLIPFRTSLYSERCGRRSRSLPNPRNLYDSRPLQTLSPRCGRFPVYPFEASICCHSWPCSTLGNNATIQLRRSPGGARIGSRLVREGSANREQFERT